MTGSKLTLLVGGISLALLSACGDNGSGTTSGSGTTGTTGAATTTGGASTTTGGASTTSTSGGSTTGGSTTGGSTSSSSSGTSTGGTGGCGATGCTPPQLCDTVSGNCVDCLNDTDCPNFTDVCAAGFCLACEPATLANAPNHILAVDGTSGVDTACCGLPGRPNLPGPGKAGPCLTITTAISNYSSGILDGGKSTAGKAMTVGYTINVAGAPAGGDWTADTTYPIWLGGGVILHAPGIYFSGSGVNTNPDSQYLDGGFTGLAAGPPTTFYVAPMWAGDDGGVRLEGATGNPVVVGVNSSGTVTVGATSPNTAVQVECPTCDGTNQESLTLQNANLAGGAPGTGFPGDGGAYGYGIGVEIGPGGQVNFGPAPVVIGNFQVNGAAVAGGGIGVHCIGIPGTSLFGDNAPDAGGTASLVTIQGQAYDIWVDSNCHGQLAGNPVLGVPAVAMACAAPKIDGDGVWLSGGQIILANGHIHCLDGDGVHIDRGTAIVANTSITHCGCSGIYNGGGSLFSRNAGNDTNILAENHTGLWADTSSATTLPVLVNFSGPGGGVPSGNQMSCASANEPGRCKPLGIPAIDVLNSVENGIVPPPQVQVDNSLWDNLVPALYICDGGLNTLSCTCAPVPSCGTFNAGAPPPDNAAIVVVPDNPIYYITPAGSARAHQACP
jgi:hypothetical protein